MLIRYRSWAHRPPHRVTCQLLDDEKQLVGRFEGLYRDSTWVFDLPDPLEWAHCRLLLDGQVAVPELPHPKGNVLDFTESKPPQRPSIWVDDGLLQQHWFDEGTRDGQTWDVIIVGQGMGGGVLHAALADTITRRGKNVTVLALEAGSLLFPTHVANLPRVSFPGPNAGGSPTMWSTLQDFGTKSVTNAEWSGFEVFAFGGRSLYWGGLAPRIRAEELGSWPDAVRRDLLEPRPNGPDYYSRAENLLGVEHRRSGPMERKALRLLDALLPRRRNQPAPVAMRREQGRTWRVPSGLFSTAELLLDQRLGTRTESGFGFGPPFIHLGELVVGMERIASGGWHLHTVQLRDGSRMVRRARRVVLCAGTIETPRLVAASKLAGLSDLAGRRLCEHPIAYRHFQVGPRSPYYDTDDEANLLSEPGNSGRDWNLHLELGSDAVLDRLPYVGNGATVVDQGHVAGQMVFFGRSDPDQQAYIQFEQEPWLTLDDPAGPNLPAATLHLGPRTQPSEWAAVSDQLLEALHARKLPQEDGKLTLSEPGAVSHEVGTMGVGTDVTTAVVDPDLQVFGCPGLYVCDNSVFPTSPAANPSLTLAALALRLADHLVPG